MIFEKKNSLCFVWMSVLALLLGAAPQAQAQVTIDTTVIMTVAGNLNNALAARNDAIKKLTLVGPLNANDFATMQKMKNLVTLDLSAATIEAVTGSMNGTNHRGVPSDYAANTIPAFAFALLEGGIHPLQQIVLPSSTEAIDSCAFKKCTNLSTITWSGSPLKSVGKEAFWGCTSLGSITLPTSIETIGRGAFARCSWLSEVDLTAAVHLTAIGDSAFMSCANMIILNLVGCTSLTTIGNRAFEGNTRLANVRFTNCSSLTTIGSQAFYKSGIKVLDLMAAKVSASQKVTLGASAFASCTQLTDIYLPLGGLNVPGGVQVFDGSTALRNVITYTNDPGLLTGSNNVWGNANSQATLSVPVASVAAYQQHAAWQGFKLVRGLLELGNTTRTYTGIGVTESSMLREYMRSNAEKDTLILYWNAAGDTLLHAVPINAGVYTVEASVRDEAIGVLETITAKLTINQAEQVITGLKTRDTCYINDTPILTPVSTWDNGGTSVTYTYTSSDATVATIDASGHVSVHGYGETMITVGASVGLINGAKNIKDASCTMYLYVVSNLAALRGLRAQSDTRDSLPLSGAGFDPNTEQYIIKAASTDRYISLIGTAPTRGSVVNVLHEPIAPGTNVFFVTGTAEDGITRQIYTITVYREAPTGVEVDKRAALIAYPNPSTGTVYLQSLDGQDTDDTLVEVYTLQGVLVQRSKGAQANLSGLGNGTYIIRNGNGTARVVKR